MVFLKPLFRSRSLRLVVGLAVAVAIPVLALVLVQFRSISDLERASVAVLETLSDQVADSLAAAMLVQFEGPSFEIERVDHLAIEQFDLATVGDTLRQRGAAVPIVDAFYLWSERSPRADTVLELPNGRHPTTSGHPVFDPAGPESGRLHELARELASYRQPWGMSVETIDGASQALVIHLLFDSSARQRLTSFIGFRIDLERLGTEQLPALLAPLVTSVNRPVGLATLVVEVVDDRGQPLYRSSPEPVRTVLQQRKLPMVFFSPGIMPAREPCDDCLPEWTLRVGYSEGTAAAIAHASTTGYRTLLGVLVLVLVLGVLLAARMALKEMQLAEAKSHFVASVSHDLKTPLALIQLFAETLELGRVRSAERAREYYRIISSEARKLATLINNVLDFSRMESGLRMYRVQPVDLGQLVRRTVSSFESQFAHEGFEAQLQVAEGASTILGDEDAIGLAVANLLSNATKYSGMSRRIGVTVTRSPRTVMVRVQDEGIGIARRHHRKIFRKFYRLEGERPDAPRGCGLGLAIVDQVMRAHRGRVMVDSEPGRGSVFTLVFPAVSEKQRDEADPRDRRRTPDAAGAA